MIPVKISGQTIQLPLKVTPRGGKNMLNLFQPGDEWVRLKVVEPPEDGKANAAVIELMAKTLDLPKRDVEIVRGETSRIKHVAVRTNTPELVLESLARQLGSSPKACFTRC